MKLIERLLMRITENLPMREINDGKSVYLVRYYIGTWLGRRYYFHHFKGSDPDRGLHNHKWFAWSLVLVGWYWEERQWGRIKVRWFNRIDPDTMHRVVLPINRIPKSKSGINWIGEPYKFIYEINDVPVSCWTLFSHRVENAVPNWGFRRNLDDSDGWVFIPYRYEREGDQTEWWLTAKTSRKLARIELTKSLIKPLKPITFSIETRGQP